MCLLGEETNTEETETVQLIEVLATIKQQNGVALKMGEKLPSASRQTDFLLEFSRFLNFLNRSKVLLRQLAAQAGCRHSFEANH